MTEHLCLSFSFPGGLFHGRGDGGAPEWPPSPLRVFQALVAAGARLGGGKLDTQAEAAIRWLAQQVPPIIITPAARSVAGYRISVPNNAMDLVAQAWSRGNYSNSGDANPATHRVMKIVHPVHVPEGASVHYIWSPRDADAARLAAAARLATLASNVVALGWGLDLALGRGRVLSEAEVAALEGDRFVPGGVGSLGLRTPVEGTLAALDARHAQFLARMADGRLTPPQSLSTYEVTTYRLEGGDSGRSLAAFSLLRIDASGFRSFDVVRSGLKVAGRVRHAASIAAQRAGWTTERVNAFVLGHTPDKDAAGGPPAARFGFLPLPSIESRGPGRARVVGRIRRVALTVYQDGCNQEVAWAWRALAGVDLVDEATKLPLAVLAAIPSTEKVVRQYTQPADTWATVTPVVLPGYDDPAHYRRRLRCGVDADEQKRLLGALDARVEALLRKAIEQAGLPRPLADYAALEWRQVGFWAGTDPARRYGVPDHLAKYPRLHVKVSWRDKRGSPVAVAGPLCIGGGRHYGLGLFAAL